jgi:hypothetical protein
VAIGGAAVPQCLYASRPWYDGASLHFACWICNWLDNFPAGLGMGSGHLASKFSQSDTPRFHFWGCLKENIYATKIKDHNSVIDQTEEAAADIRNPLRQIFDITVRCVWDVFPEVLWCTCTHPYHTNKMCIKRAGLKWWLKIVQKQNLLSSFI